MLRLSVLEELDDAQILFRVAVRPPRGALTESPLGAPELLEGRRRARDRASGPRVSAAPPPPVGAFLDPARANACRALGISVAAEADEVKRAYRRLVRSYHPDLHPDATHDERVALSRRFAEVTAAYRALVA